MLSRSFGFTPGTGGTGKGFSTTFERYVNFVCITNAFRLNCIFEKFLNVRSLFVFNSLSHPLIFKICVNQLLMSVLLYQQKKLAQWHCCCCCCYNVMKMFEIYFECFSTDTSEKCLFVRSSVRLSVLRFICFLTF